MSIVFSVFNVLIVFYIYVRLTHIIKIAYLLIFLLFIYLIRQMAAYRKIYNKHKSQKKKYLNYTYIE